MKLFGTTGGKMKKLLFVLFTITIVSMCFGELNLSEKKMIYKIQCPDGKIIAVEDINRDGVKDGIIYSELDGSLYAITNMNEGDAAINFVEILPEGSIEGKILKCNFRNSNTLRLWIDDFHESTGPLKYQDVNFGNNQISPTHTFCDNVNPRYISDDKFDEIDLNNDNVNEFIIQKPSGFDVFSNDYNYTLCYSFVYNDVEAVVIGNYDNDSLDDIFVTCPDEIIILRNEGNFLFSPISIQDSVNFSFNDIFFADYDADSDTDIFNFYGNYVQGTITCYINNNGDFSSSVSNSYSILNPPLDMDYFILEEIIDLNNDNKADLLFSEHYRDWDGFDSYDSWMESEIVFNENGNYNITFDDDFPYVKTLDVNNDSLPDLVSIYDEFKYYYNNSDSSGSFTELTIEENPTGWGYPLSLITDLNNDNILDLIQSSCYKDNLHFYISNNDNTFRKTSKGRADKAIGNFIFFSDIDQNNNPELLFKSTDNRFYGSFDVLQSNTPQVLQRLSAPFPYTSSSSGHGDSSGTGYSKFTLMDINNDSILDLVYYKYNYSMGICRSIYSYLTMCSSIMYMSSETHLESIHNWNITIDVSGQLSDKDLDFLDFDFDGLPDIYQAEEISDNNYSTIWHIRIPGSIASTLPGNISTAKLNKGKRFDIDDDGDEDFVFGNYNYGYDSYCDSIFWIENAPGNDLNSTPSLLFTTDSLHSFASFSIEDITGDNLADIILLTEDRTTLYCAEATESSFNDLNQIFQSESSISKLKLQDIDRDYDKDIIINYNLHNSISLLQNNGSQNFSIVYTADNEDNLWNVTDIDFDGDIDFLYFDTNKGQVYWKKNLVYNPTSDTSAPSFSASITNYPNPFNPSTNISFNIKEDTDVEITIYNIKGQKVKTLVDRKFGQGQHKVEWNGTDSANKSVGSGVYFYKVDYNGKTQAVKKCVMLK